MEHDLALRAFAPAATLTTPATLVEHPRFPVVDAHNHLGELLPGASFAGNWPRRPVEELVAELDRSGVRAVVDLDGGFGERLRREIARYCEPYPDRFVVFAGLDYDAFGRERDIGGHLARQLRDSAAAGARGLKVWKPLGLRLRDETGRLFPVDDPRLDELWATAGELRLPVLIHVADPVAFFRPLDRFNERWEELHAHPDWHFYGGDFPTFDQLIAQLAEVVGRHRATTFIGAHVGCYAENLGWVGALLERCPNFFVDIGARLGELGRQPYTARDFFIRYADRVLFGTDQPPRREVYQLHYRFLETRDEYFNYGLGEIPSQGRWMIYGLSLPDETLRKVYYENAARLLGLSPLT
jgi:predicted TIM-barrel fold metal-dependent hydrolase